MENLVVKIVETQREHQAALIVRVRVFVQEQGVPVEEELDEDDLSATHAIALVNGEVVGTGRVLCPDSGDARIGRMAVDEAWRRKGIGSHILMALEEAARQRGRREAILHAQTYVKDFYASHGYIEEGEVFLEVGIEHVQMRKRL